MCVNQQPHGITNIKIMKKLLLSAALLIAVSIGAKAQVSLGIKGGVNFSKISTDNVKESTLTGYQAGLFARIGSAWYLQPELYLSGTGGKFESSDNNTAFDGKVRFTNLNVPLLIGRSFGQKDLNFRVMGGPIYTYQLDNSVSLGSNLSGAANNFNKSNIGYQVGAGVDIGSITADLRYEGGLTKVSDSFAKRQNLWALSVGFKIL
ncbi:Outer membrane protein beta-barrel domain-containing protein [Mucilaginibacter lappiensis]|nr:Outer membrane protein beta-barrel domain-containing protein [Mucilaginibacter lappiensis]